MSVSAYRLPNNTSTAAARAKRLFDSIQARFQKKELRSHEDIRSAVYEAFREAFLYAGEPTFVGGELPQDVPRLIEHYKPLIEKLADDLYVAYKESKAIAQTSASTYNYQTAIMGMLTGQIKRAGSTLIDLQITNDRFLGPVIVAGDDFNDTSRLDNTVALTLPKADVNNLGGVLTLARTSNKSVIDIDAVRITVEPLQGYKQRLYEGQFFGLAGQAVPEGGQFRFVEKKPGDVRKESIPADLLRRFSDYVITGGKAAASIAKLGATEALEIAKQKGSYEGITKEEWELIASQPFAGAELATLPPGTPKEFTSGVDPNVVFVDQGALPEQRLALRKAMVDGNPDTFWQIEYTVQAAQIEKDFATQIGAVTDQPTLSDSLATLINKKQKDFDAIDLDVRITIDLGSEQTVNWIDLIPMFFEGIEHLKVLGIRSSQNGTRWVEIPSLNSVANKSISRDSNSEVSEEVVKTALAPSTSAFAGRGLWVFPPMTLRYLQIDLRQPVPVIAPYQTLAAEISRTVHRRHSANAFGKRRQSTTTQENRVVTLSYPETVLVTTGAADPEDATKTQGLSVSKTGGDKLFKDASIAFAAGGDFITSSILRGISELIGRIGAGKTSTSETIVRQWLETKWDMARYAIGIQDIGIWQYEFVQESEMVSIPFRTPGPIRSIALEVDEVVPSEFNKDQRIASWIDYYVSVGGNTDWQPIAPVTSRVVRNLEGGHVPGIIHVNAGIPASERNPGEGYIDLDQEVDTVQFRAVLRRPDAFINATPALRSYRLLMTTQTASR